MVMCPAPVAQITNFQTDFLIGQWTSLMHILGLHLRFLLLLCLLGGPQLLRFEVVMDLSIEVTLERDLPAAFLGRGGVVKKFIVVSVVVIPWLDPFHGRHRLAPWGLQLLFITAHHSNIILLSRIPACLVPTS